LKLLVAEFTVWLIYKNDKAQRHPYWTFDVERSMFDVHKFVFRLDRLFFCLAAVLTPETINY